MSGVVGQEIPMHVKSARFYEEGLEKSAGGKRYQVAEKPFELSS
jgi:hypothetical protein